MHLTTLGRLASIFQKAPAAIALALEVAGLSPELVLNELRYFDETRAFEVLAQKNQDGCRKLTAAANR